VLTEKEFPYTNAYNPVVAYGRFKKVEVIFVSLAPKPDCKFSLILSQGEMLDVVMEDRMKDSIHGWFKPTKPVDEFLTSSYSLEGSTHHSALVYGNDEVKSEIKL
jgi:L-arabinose isomerase